MKYKDASSLTTKPTMTVVAVSASMPAIRDKIAWCLKRAEEAGLAVSEMKAIYVRPTLHGGTTAGRAQHKRDGHYISVHPGLLHKYGQDYIDKTVVHEIAHCIQKHICHIIDGVFSGFGNSAQVYQAKIGVSIAFLSGNAHFGRGRLIIEFYPE